MASRADGSLKDETGDVTPDATSIGRSATMMGMLVIISRITGFFRTWTQAYALGAGLLASCYTVANNLPNQLYELVIGGMIVTAFLPVYMSIKEKSGSDGANAYVSNLLSLVTILMGACTVLCVVFASQLVFLQSAGTDQSQMADATFLFRFFAIEVLLYCLSSVASGILNAERDYLWSNAAPIVNNIVVIVSFVAYRLLSGTNVGLAMLLLALGNPLGVLAQVVVQMPSLRRHGVRLTWRVDVRAPAIRETLSIGIPTLVVTVCSFVTVSVMNTYSLVAVPESGSSIQYYARLWYTLPYSVLSIPITTALFTEMSAFWAKGRTGDYEETVTKGASDILFVLMPFMLYLIVFAEPLMLLLRSGRFTVDDAKVTAGYLRWLAIALPFYGLSTFFQKVFSSMRNMAAFAVSSIVASACQVVFTMLVTDSLGITAVALGSVMFYVIVDAVSLVLIRRRCHGVRFMPMVGAFLDGLVCGLFGSLAGMLVMRQAYGLYGTGQSIGMTLLCLAIGGVVALTVTYVTARLFGIEKVDLVTNAFIHFFSRNKKK